MAHTDGVAASMLAAVRQSAPPRPAASHRRASPMVGFPTRPVLAQMHLSSTNSFCISVSLCTHRSWLSFHAAEMALPSAARTTPASCPACDGRKAGRARKIRQRNTDTLPAVFRFSNRRNRHAHATGLCARRHQAALRAAAVFKIRFPPASGTLHHGARSTCRLLGDGGAAR